MKVLDLTGKGSELLPDAEILTELNGEALDVVLVGNAICAIEPNMLLPTLKSWAEAMNEGAEMHIQVPSAEWEAREWLGGRVNPGLWEHRYGGGKYRVAFRLEDLRALIAVAGLRVADTDTRPYVILRAAEGNEELLGEMHYVVAFKGKPQAWIG